jgi:modulator of FtsH protease
VQADWQTFFLAQVGASAALTGLVFVALSINLSQIIGQRDLVGRAGEAVILLVQPVIVGLAVLTPYSGTTRGVLILLAAGTAWVALVRLLINSDAEAQRPKLERVYRLTSTQLAAVPAVIGAVVLIAGGDGYGFLALGAVMSIAVGVMDGWVLLVEILR